MYWVWKNVLRKFGEDRNTFLFIFLAARFRYNTCTVAGKTCVGTKRLNEYLTSEKRLALFQLSQDIGLLFYSHSTETRLKKNFW